MQVQSLFGWLGGVNIRLGDSPDLYETLSFDFTNPIASSRWGDFRIAIGKTDMGYNEDSMVKISEIQMDIDPERTDIQPYFVNPPFVDVDHSLFQRTHYVYNFGGSIGTNQHFPIQFDPLSLWIDYPIINNTSLLGTQVDNYIVFMPDSDWVDKSSTPTEMYAIRILNNTPRSEAGGR